MRKCHARILAEAALFSERRKPAGVLTRGTLPRKIGGEAIGHQAPPCGPIAKRRRHAGERRDHFVRREFLEYEPVAAPLGGIELADGIAQPSGSTDDRST